MRKFFSNRRLVMIVVALVVAFGLMGGSVTLRNNRLTPPLIQQFGNDIIGFGNDIIASPANAVQNVFTNYSDLLNTYHENKELKQQVAEVAQTKVRDQVLAKENKQLKAELNMKNSMTDYELITAAVITRSPSAWQQQLVVNKGQSSGIRKNMPVMSASSLIGRVEEVNKTNSKIELLSDTSEAANRFAIEIDGKNGKTVNGVITGYQSETNELVMGQVTTKASISKGTKVYTNGMGGITPKGLYVGKVSRVGKDDYGLAQKVYIKPSADFNNLNVVSIAKTDN